MKAMDWGERQIPPPSWHDGGDIPKGFEDDSFYPLTSVVRKCYLQHLEQTLLQNYKSCRTHSIQQSTLQDIILHWEQNALRACMVTTIYQKVMRQLINAIKADTKENKLTSVLTATIKQSQRQHFVDVSTQTETVSTTTLPTKHAPVNGHDPQIHLTVPKKESVSRDSSLGSSDGPFLTPPSDYSILNLHASKKSSRRQIQFPPQTVPDPIEHDASYQNPVFTEPFQFTVPPPGYPYLAQQPYLGQVACTNNWSGNHSSHEVFPVQPISVVTNIVSESHYDVGNSFTMLPEEQNVNSNQILMTENTPVEKSFNEDVLKNVEFPLGPNDSAEPDYDWDQIEEEMARLYGQAFTEDDCRAILEDPEPEPNPRPVALPEEANNLSVIGPFHEAQLQARLDFVRKHWSLERQARLKRKFIELFGREEEDDQLAQISAKEATKCKQRIAPWIVKHLMPLYKEKRIASRHLFKSLAKHISDLLIQRNLYPDECDVWMGVQEFFQGGTIIECEADFCS